MEKITFELQVYKDGYILDKKDQFGEVLQGKIYFEKDDMLKDLSEMIDKIRGDVKNE